MNLDASLSKPVYFVDIRMIIEKQRNSNTFPKNNILCVESFAVIVFIMKSLCKIKLNLPNNENYIIILQKI